MSKSTQQTMDEMLGDLAPLPWSIGAAPDDDCIVDANNMLVATVNRDHPAAQQCMTALVCAVNTLAGYKAEVTN
jgi:hypothetical protein